MTSPQLKINKNALKTPKGIIQDKSNLTSLAFLDRTPGLTTESSQTQADEKPGPMKERESKQFQTAPMKITSKKVVTQDLSKTFKFPKINDNFVDITEDF